MSEVLAAIGLGAAKKSTRSERSERLRATLKNMPSTPKKPPYESRARTADPHGRRSDKLESIASKLGARANKAYAHGKLKRSGKLAAKASKLHSRADKASGKYQARKARKAKKSPTVTSAAFGAIAT